MKLRIFRILTICIVLLSINPVLTVSALGTETISIGSAEMNTGETVIIPITIADAVDVGGIQLNVIYDPDVVMALDITVNDCFPSSNIFPNTDNPGNATLMLLNANNITAASATPFADITFQAHTAGYSTLELKNVKLTMNYTSLDPGTVNNGEITINSNQGSTDTESKKNGANPRTSDDQSGFTNDTNVSAGGGEGIAPEPAASIETTTIQANEQSTDQTASDEKSSIPGFGLLLSLLVLLIAVKMR